jgi:hypothetical protein
VNSETGSIRRYFEILASCLFLFLGGVILVRTVMETRLFLGFVVGGAFFAYGAWRMKYVWRFLAGRKGP